MVCLWWWSFASERYDIRGIGFMRQIWNYHLTLNEHNSIMGKEWPGTRFTSQQPMELPCASAKAEEHPRRRIDAESSILPFSWRFCVVECGGTAPSTQLPPQTALPSKHLCLVHPIETAVQKNQGWLIDCLRAQLFRLPTDVHRRKKCCWDLWSFVIIRCMLSSQQVFYILTSCLQPSYSLYRCASISRRGLQ